MNQDIADNVLKKGREGIKENLLEAFSGFADEYADEMWTLVNELIRLRTENRALREEKSPKKPISLIEYTRIKDELRSKVDYIHEQDKIIKEYKGKIENGEIDYVADKDKQIARLTAERDDYKSRAEAAEQEATVWKDCANRWQKYYKGQAKREIKENNND